VGKRVSIWSLTKTQVAKLRRFKAYKAYEEVRKAIAFANGAPLPAGNRAAYECVNWAIGMQDEPEGPSREPGKVAVDIDAELGKLPDSNDHVGAATFALCHAYIKPDPRKCKDLLQWTYWNRCATPQGRDNFVDQFGGKLMPTKTQLEQLYNREDDGKALGTFIDRVGKAAADAVLPFGTEDVGSEPEVSAEADTDGEREQA